MQKPQKPQQKSKKKHFPFKGKRLPSGALEDKEITEVKSKYDSIVSKNVNKFNDLPLSRKTIRALVEHKYVIPTEIQRQSIGYALQGRDVLGAAVTGSGKTLAFLIPVVEKLFTLKWVRQDGVGAIIISPTRELAYQIFETLKKIGKYHDFSAGLIIGGKDLKFERNRMDQCNVIICTPGRLLHHMDQNPLFNSSTLQILVLDEADRCLDMGFETEMNAIIENLPPERQTLLFSATQTKSVKDLARLSLTNPVYVAPHEQSDRFTPDALRQNYVVIELEDKLTMLWSFIKNHSRQKCIVFLSTCKQVKYMTDILRHLRPTVKVLGLHGGMHQLRRMDVYDEFCKKSNVVLLATDIASRGLDFPTVNWVIQLDCPEDGVQYIHRAGRTARHTANGESLLVLLPSEEEGMLNELKKHKIVINKIQIDPKKMWSPIAKIEAFLAREYELKQSAQRAFVAYVQSVWMMKNKEIFKVNEMNTDAFSKSLGLAIPPRIKFLKKDFNKKTESSNGKKAVDEKLLEAKNSEDESEEEEEENSNEESEAESSDEGEENEEEGVSDDGSGEDEKPQNKNADFNVLDSSDEENDANDDFLKVKRRDHEILEEELPEVPSIDEIKQGRKDKVITKAAVAKKILKKKILPNTKVVFDETGVEVEQLNTLKSELAKTYEESTSDGINIEKARELIQEEDKFDKEYFKQRVKAKRREKKAKLKKQNGEQEEKDDFGDDGSDYEPDLSWLPSVNKGSDDEEENSPDDDSEDESESNKFNKKRYHESSSENDSDYDEKPVAKKVRNITSKLSVNEAEEFAMQLLQK